ncbi:MAG: ECF transporter S component [Bacilli bacterium]|nr:ECF transporter S component [Bacilli bacterium]
MAEKKNYSLVYLISMTAMFTALCFGGCFVMIPLGASKIHLGNLICLLASLLCGPFVGAFAGSVGMGVSDIVAGYGIDTILRTFVVKAVLGLVSGFAFRWLIKGKKPHNWLLFLLSGVFYALFILFLSLYLFKGETIPLGERKLVVSILLIVSTGVLGTLLLIAGILFKKKLGLLAQFVVVSSLIGLLINMILEFALKIPLKMWIAEMSLEGAFIYAVSSLPSALITSSITLVIASLLYQPLYLASRRINHFDSLSPYIEEVLKSEEEKAQTEE